jgi:hypothetical protein
LTIHKLEAIIYIVRIYIRTTNVALLITFCGLLSVRDFETDNYQLKIKFQWKQKT